jgi:mono/diheme cytochrome c family protein
MTRTGSGARTPTGAGALVAMAATALVAIAVVVGGCGGGGAPPKNASPGLQAYDNASCGSCHTLAAAHSTGTAGTKLDGLGLDAATVERTVRKGAPGMPSFTDQLSDEQIRQLADFVARSSHGTT